MVTISHLVEKIVSEKPFLEEELAKGVINYAALAKILKPQIEKDLKKNIKDSAIMMALRRLAEKLESQSKKTKIRFKETDINIRSGLFEITIAKSSNSIGKITKIYSLLNLDKGDFLTITQGLHEFTIISNEKYSTKIRKILDGEKISITINKLASLTIKIPIESIEQVGLFYLLTKTLNWENINIVEIVSTSTEMTFILKEDDVPKAYSAVNTLIQNSN
jgi:aspartokinase